MRNSCCLLRKVRKFSSLQILQSGCNLRHLNSKAFLDCKGLQLNYMDYMVIKWIAEQGNPKQSKGNLCNPSAIHCNIGLQFGFAIQSNLCNLTAMQEDCSLIVEIAVWLLRLQYDCWDCKCSTTYLYMPQPSTRCQAFCEVFFSDCWDCSLIAEIAVWLLRLPKFHNLLIHAQTLHKVSGILRGVFFWLLRLQSDYWDCSLIAEIAVWNKWNDRDFWTKG